MCFVYVLFLYYVRMCICTSMYQYMFILRLYKLYLNVSVFFFSHIIKPFKFLKLFFLLFLLFFHFLLAIIITLGLFRLTLGLGLRLLLIFRNLNLLNLSLRINP